MALQIASKIRHENSLEFEDDDELLGNDVGGVHDGGDKKLLKVNTRLHGKKPLLDGQNPWSYNHGGVKISCSTVWSGRVNHCSTFARRSYFRRYCNQAAKRSNGAVNPFARH